MASASELYAIDASSFLTIDQVFEPTQRKHAWRIVDDLIASGRVKTAAVVLDEVKQNSRSVFDKLSRRRSDLVVPINPQLFAEAGRLAFKYPIMSHIDREKDSGDPWVIAIARVYDYKVICEESRIKEQRMAWVCTREGVPCGNIHEMLRANGMPRDP